MNSPRRISKVYRFEPLPQLTGELPLLLDYSVEIRTAKKVDSKEKRAHVDLSRVEEVDVIGAVAFAANIAKSICRFPEFTFQILLPKAIKASQLLVDLEYESLLIHLGMKPAMGQDLWSTSNAPFESRLVWSASCNGGRETLLFIPPADSISRETLLKEVRDRLQIFYFTNPSETVNYGQFHQILHEIIKNTIDHSGKAGVLGLKFDSLSNGHDKLSFVYCEMGDGISLNVRDFLSRSPSISDRKLAKKGGFSDFLFWALKPGNTSKPHSVVNAGLGLSTIGAAARGEWIRLFISDARSIAYVTDISDADIHNHTYELIRNKIHHSLHIPCFMYYGHTTCEEQTYDISRDDLR